MFKKTLTSIMLLVLVCTGARAQQPREFKQTLDSLQVLMQERTTVKIALKINKVVSRGDALDFTFTSSLGDYPWRQDDVRFFKRNFKNLLPNNYRNKQIGEILVGKNKLETYVMPTIGNSGKPGTAMFRTRDRRDQTSFIRETGAQNFAKGLSGRTIALWQSHGRYYEEKTQRWEWQRAPLLQTVEDMYTQSYVLPFLMPMLENAGAYVMTPRERDTQRNEIIADNDPSFDEGRTEGIRIKGNYSESGIWSNAGTGFADFKAAYVTDENPFLAGTARKASCRASESGGKAEAVWTPEIPSRGRYAVYISYKSLPNSTECARYTVRHLAGSTEFIVNQKMGGGTWIYLGTFEFGKGSQGCVILDNGTPEGCTHIKNSVVTADAVRFGGGMGKIARGQKDQDTSEYTVSGVPSFAEGALYWMQWAGADTTLLHLHEDDYTSDYADRGAWVSWMSGGSRTNPQEEGLGIPIDLSFAMHTDAGTSQNDSIIGTLSIYTLLCEGSDKLPNGESRQQGRLFADYVQTQIVNDLRKDWNPLWSRRGLWDRSYSESRTTTVPGILLELLSHQNFGDMKFGLDPAFRFTVSRSIYKGFLKFLSSRYGCEYSVQPLPVNSFSTSFRSVPVAGNASQIRLTWKPTTDSLEVTASPTGYILQTRIDDGAFNKGEIIDAREIGGKLYYDLTIKPGRIYSYRIIAFNEGGKSFPSEVLSIGIPSKGKGKGVVVVNNFTRVSPPAWFDTPEYAGFNNVLDSGVPYVEEINFIGDQYEFRRDLPWVDDDNPGFGASFTDQAGKVIPGNTFDYTTIHGKAILASGRPFHSVSAAAFISDPLPSKGDCSVDIICGKQVTTPIGNGTYGSRFQVFAVEFQEAIRQFSSAGGNLLVSGANIGTDIWDKVFPVKVDPEYTAKAKEFAQTVLGYKWMTNFATNNNEVWPMKNGYLDLAGKTGKTEFWRERNDVIYNVETPDGIVPASDRSHTFLRYSDTNISAATCFEGDGYKSACLGFPLEVLKSQEDINAIVAEILSYFENQL